MRKFLTTLTIFFLFVAPVVAEAAANCPAEVQSAKDMLKKQTAKADEAQAPRTLAGAKSQKESNVPRARDESQAPRDVTGSQAPRSRDLTGSQAPRDLTGSQAPRDLTGSQAPRDLTGSQAPRDITGSQAPRTLRPRDESQAPRDLTGSQAPRDITGSQAPRGQDSDAPRAAASAPQVSKARILINEAEAACKAGDMTKATQKAKAAMELLKK